MICLYCCLLYTSIFERFNIDRPEDFRGHSLSVSDIIVLNDGEKVTAHFVDSISFEQLDSFLNLEEMCIRDRLQERMPTVPKMRLPMQRMELREQMPIRFWKIDVYKRQANHSRADQNRPDYR